MLMKTKLLILLAAVCVAQAAMATNGESVYKLRPQDPGAHYFSYEEIGMKAGSDVSVPLQEMINRVAEEEAWGVIFVGPGRYTISRTIFIPRGIRVIGYGEKRPEFVLAPGSPGFQKEVEGDKGRAAYMFWFTSGVVKDPGGRIPDASPSTFYSCMANINLRIGAGNPWAVALRTHYAQHSYVAHMDVHAEEGRAGLFEVGNEMENVRFYGGDWGIYTTKASPGWPMMMVDVLFEGQRKAAIRSQEGGMAIVRMTARRVPCVVEIDENYADKLFMEDCVWDGVSGPAVVVSNVGNAANQISLRNVVCRAVPVLVAARTGEVMAAGVGRGVYRVKSFTHGLEMEGLDAVLEMVTKVETEPMAKMPGAFEKDIPAIPEMSSWVSVRDFGAVGDGKTDDTEAVKRAVAANRNVYFPQGWYVVSETIELKPETNLIALHPFGTQLMLAESTPAFSGFGSPKALLETPVGGKNIVTGLGINTGAYNYRAVGVKWQAGEKSYMNDVKFVGGHGGMTRPGPEADAERASWSRPPKISTPREPSTAPGMDYAWDTQYWSMWVTNGGGGTFKNIWSASSYAASGLYVSDTETPGRIYAMSLEHHVRNEARFKNVANWKAYAFQFEEENREGRDCQPLELENCRNMLIANLYMFQVIRVNTPYPYAVRTWGCEDVEFVNVHNYAQTKYAAVETLYDVNTGRSVRPWEMARLVVRGNEARAAAGSGCAAGVGRPERLATGFEFAVGASSDSKGNVYFCEQRMRRVYKWSVETGLVTMVADFQWEPMATGVDTEDNLLVVFRYAPQPGTDEKAAVYPDTRGTSFAGYGNGAYSTMVYAVDPQRPEETIRLLEKRPMGSVARVAKALYPSNRWRDFHDFNTVVSYRPAECWVAPDGVTIVPEQYDLARGVQVLEAVPGVPFYTADEYDKRMVRLDVAADGGLGRMEYFVETGEFGSAVDGEGNLYVADGQVYVFNAEGERIGVIEVPERPLTLAFGGADGKTLFMTTHKSLYRVSVGCGASVEAGCEEEKVVLGYVTARGGRLPDPNLLTHVNYAFGRVTETFDGIRVNNPQRLHEVVGLKRVNPDFKVLLSIGGWGAGRFSEMAADDELRRAFAADARRVVDEFGLDGIDIDWEYPTSNAAGISASPNDTENFTLLMRDLREAIGPGKLLTLATVATGEYIDFRAIDKYIDLVNIMSYDMDHTGKAHHSGLYRSERSPVITTHEAVGAHLTGGVPANKLVIGVPFYGRSTPELKGSMRYHEIVEMDGEKYSREWDDAAKAPYIVDEQGEMVVGYDDAESLAIKTKYIRDNRLRGIMYWEFGGDTEEMELSKVIYYGLYPEKKCENK